MAEEVITIDSDDDDDPTPGPSSYSPAANYPNMIPVSLESRLGNGNAVDIEYKGLADYSDTSCSDNLFTLPAL